MNRLNHVTARYAPYLYMLLAMAMWAIIENIPRYFSQHYTTFEIVWLRYSVHLLFMIVVFGPKVKLRLVRTHRLGAQFVRGLLMMGMHLSFIFAVKYVPVNTTMAGFWITPMLILALSAWRGEKADWVQWVISIAGFGFTLVILRPITGLIQPATLLAVAMAACFVLYMQMTRSMTSEDILTSLFYTAFSVWIILSVLMPFYWVTPKGWDILLFIAIGILGFFCIFGFDKAAEVAPTWLSAPFALIQPILVIGIDWLLHGINPGRLSIASAAFILAGFALIAWRHNPLHLQPGHAHA